MTGLAAFAAHGALVGWIAAVLIAAIAAAADALRSRPPALGSAPPSVILGAIPAPSRDALGRRVTLTGRLVPAPGNPPLERRERSLALTVVGDHGAVLRRSVPAVLRTDAGDVALETPIEVVGAFGALPVGALRDELAELAPGRRGLVALRAGAGDRVEACGELATGASDAYRGDPRWVLRARSVVFVRSLERMPMRPVLRAAGQALLVALAILSAGGWATARAAGSAYDGGIDARMLHAVALCAPYREPALSLFDRLDALAPDEHALEAVAVAEGVRHGCAAELDYRLDRGLSLHGTERCGGPRRGRDVARALRAEWGPLPGR